MTASKVKALIVGLVLVCGVVLGATLWRQQHPDMPEVARLASPMPQATAPQPTAPSKPQESAKLESPSQPQSTPSKPQDFGELAPAAKPEPAPKPEPAAGAGEAPHFDVVRVEPTGDAVIAGKGDPNAKVELLAWGKVIAETKADSSGHFVILPATLAPGNYDLTLRQTPDGKTALESMQSVAVSVPAKGGQVVVAMAEPGKPTKMISGPPEAPPAPEVAKSPPAAEVSALPAKPPETLASETLKPETLKPETSALAKPQMDVVPPAVVKPAGPGLAIRSVELENGNGFFASGVAAPGTRVQIYLNGSHLAEVVAGPDGQWTVTIKQGLTGGHYAVRADVGEGDAVTSRVEVPFDVPVAMAQVVKPAAPVPAEVAATEPPSAPTPDEAASASAPSQQVAVAPEAPAAVPADAPTPRPDLAAAAKAAVAAAPPTLAAVQSAAPAPADTPVAPAKPPGAPPTLAAAISPPKPTEVPDPSNPVSSANAIIEQVDTALVIPGDNLWNISRVRLGHGKRFTQIYAANVSQIRDPRLIFPGQVFVVPAR